MKYQWILFSEFLFFKFKVKVVSNLLFQFFWNHFFETKTVSNLSFQFFWNGGFETVSCPEISSSIIDLFTNNNSFPSASLLVVNFYLFLVVGQPVCLWHKDPITAKSHPLFSEKFLYVGVLAKLSFASISFRMLILGAYLYPHIQKCNIRHHRDVVWKLRPARDLKWDTHPCSNRKWTAMGSDTIF